MKLEFSRQFSKNTHQFYANPSSGAESFYADRRTDMTKLIVAFRNFVNALKKQLQKRNTPHCHALSWCLLLL